MNIEQAAMNEVLKEKIDLTNIEENFKKYVTYLYPKLRAISTSKPYLLKMLKMLS